MPTIAIYARKSRFNSRSESVSTQITLCREHCERLFPGSEYIIYDSDEGYSGKNTNRPGFQCLMGDIQNRRVQVVCVYRLDRLSRSLSDFTQLLDMFQRYNVSFVSLRESFDTSTPMGRAMLYFTSVISQLERETLAERVMDNIYELAKTGRWLGGQTPTGFIAAPMDASHDGSHRTAVRLLPADDELSIVRTVYSTFLLLGSLSKLYTYCLTHGLRSRNGIAFSRTTLRALLTNPVYCTADPAAYQYFSAHPCQLCANESDFDGTHGLMPFNRTCKSDAYTLQKDPSEWIIAIGQHPGTITGADWVRVQQMLEQNKELGKTFQAARTETALLSGVIRCACCGSVMRPKVYGKPLPDGSRRFHYICTNKQETRGELCSMANAPGNDVDGLVIAHLANISANDPAFSSGASGSFASGSSAPDLRQQIRTLEKSIASDQRKIDNIVSAIADGAPAAMRQRLYDQMEQLQANIEKSQQSIADLNASILDTQGQQQLADLLRSIFASFSSAFASQSYDERRRLIRSVVDSVIWDGSNVTINILGANTLPK